ncbi:DUF4838 domain-containing protein [Phycisphaerales bacterium AB-hyl4]|uniref:DUF4838 domain-containing protein n=1 Tax=Natronomicrosphaera hydrolytica TaxID=3242702 RepID=A0ABV4U196_9BACT
MWCVVSSARGEVVLADAGATEYVIVIGANASKAEQFAAEELSLFLHQMTDADFKVVTDEHASGRYEFVVGQTNRLDIDETPDNLKPTGTEGFAIIVDDDRVAILGNTGRATLYGVYDFLEHELGCRFIASDMTHVPSKPTLRVGVQSRVFSPKLEYRNLHQGTTQWSVRNRLNAVWGTVPNEAIIGGARFIGPSFVHTFGELVPEAEYFEAHPEYYALWEGKRVPAAIGGKTGGLCLTHPDVLRITIASVRDWIADYRRRASAHPDTLLLVSVSANDDHHLVCQCTGCQAVNKEEDAPSGTLIRFVNEVAEQIGADEPMVRIETLAYGFSETPPAKTKPHDNVIIRFAPISADFARPFNDTASERNRQVHHNLQQWSKLTDNIYIWDYRTNFHAYLKPFPDLRVLEENMRYLIDAGLRGYYAQTAQTESATFSRLRRYVLAKQAWRPDTNVQQAINEFCQLYYGPAAPYVLQYIDMVHDYFASLDIPLRWRDGSSPDGADYDYSFLAEVDDVLEKAEAAAETEAQTRRVTEERLTVWYMLVRKALAGDVEGDSHHSLPLTWQFRTDPEDEGLSEQWQAQSDFESWGPIRVDESWTNQGHAYHGVAWYSLMHSVDDADAGRFDAIRFGAIDGDEHQIFINGELVDERVADAALTWNEPFQVNLDEPLAGGEHTIVVRVKKASRAAGIWRPVTLVDQSQGLPGRIHTAGSRFIEVSEAMEVSHLSEFYGRHGEQVEHFNRRIKVLLMQDGASREDDNPNRIARQPAALLENEHRMFTVEFDESALNGACVSQPTDRSWTINQSIRWNALGELMSDLRPQEDRPVTLRVRVRTEGLRTDTGGFRFGIARRLGKDHGWRATAWKVVRVPAAETSDKTWQWYEMTVPDDTDWSDALYYAFVWPEQNSGEGGRVLVDTFELVYSE